MANADKPFGFRFAFTRTGGPPSLRPYKNTAAIIYPGDYVEFDGSGRISSVSDDEEGFGVAASYGAVAGDDTVYVYDDLQNTIFTVQMDGADVTDDTSIGNLFDIVATTGDTSTLQSKMELDSSDSTHDHLLLIGLVDSPDNAWGNHCNVYVRFNTDERLQVITGTA